MRDGDTEVVRDVRQQSHDGEFGRPNTKRSECEGDECCGHGWITLQALQRFAAASDETHKARPPGWRNDSLEGNRRGGDVLSVAAVQQVLLMVGEGFFVGGVLLLAYRLRDLFGPSPVYIIFGIIFLYASLLAEDMYIRLNSWLIVSPGCVVLLPAVLFFVLVVYLTSDAVEARKLIYGVSGANIALLPIGLVIALELQSPTVGNPHHLVPELFIAQPRVVIASALVVFFDTLLVVLTYEFVRRRIRSLFIRVLLSLTIALAFDSVCFVTATQVEDPAYADTLISQLVGKTVAAFVYASVFAAYVRWFRAGPSVISGDGRSLGEMFRVLTYRRRYEELRRVTVRDGLTEVYNRRYFDEAFAKAIDRAERSGSPCCLLMIDVDDFKRLNDAYGHAEGDTVLQRIAQAIVASVRVSDEVCRYGGEEFAVLLPHTDLARAVALSERIGSQVPEACATGWRGAGSTSVTVTIGVAAFPEDAPSGVELLRIADRRLYAGKAAGRNRVIESDLVS